MHTSLTFIRIKFLYAWLLLSTTFSQFESKWNLKQLKIKACKRPKHPIINSLSFFWKSLYISLKMGRSTFAMFRLPANMQALENFTNPQTDRLFPQCMIYPHLELGTNSRFLPLCIFAVHLILLWIATLFIILLASIVALPSRPISLQAFVFCCESRKLDNSDIFDCKSKCWIGKARGDQYRWIEYLTTKQGKFLVQ